MATFAQTPRGRGYDQSLHYFHHANDYWTYEVGSCSSPNNSSVKLGITDLWEGKLGGDEGPAHARVGANQNTCPYYQQANRSDCAYEDTVFTDFVVDVIKAHPSSRGPTKSAVSPLFFCW